MQSKPAAVREEPADDPRWSRARPAVLLLGAAELAPALQRLGLPTQTAPSLRQALAPTAHSRVRAIVIRTGTAGELALPEAIASLRRSWPLVDVVVWAPRASGTLVRDALRAGARDVLLSQSPGLAAESVRRVIEDQKLLPRVHLSGGGSSAEHQFEGILSRSARMWDLFEVCMRVATTGATVLILGETGTGKELIARAIHRQSKRKGRFVAVNCGAVPESLIDSELFGHIKGTFTGATADKHGLFRHADGGTLMLDEIGNIPLAAQFRLLRALQEGTIRPVGAHQEVPVDVRVVAATSTALEDDVQAGRFREDLFYRLDVIRLVVPPLRERPEDIVFLFAHFARRIAKQYNTRRPEVHDSFLDALLSYEWPGNVRQLENLTERLVLTHPEQRLTAQHLRKLLPFQKQRDARAPKVAERPVDGPDLPPFDPKRTLGQHLQPVMARLERAYLEGYLRETQGRVGEAATKAGINRRTMLRKMAAYGLNKRTYRAGRSS